MRRWIALSLVPFVVACSGPATASTPPTPTPASQAAPARPADAKPAASTPTAAAKSDAKPAAQAGSGPSATIAPPDQSAGIAFGQPVKIGPNSVAILVTNTTDEVRSFDAKVSYTKGPATVDATAKVEGLGPKQSRAVSLVATTLIPAGPDAVTVGLGKLREVDREDAAAMTKIAVGEPKQREGTTTYTVDVTNGDGKSRVIGLYAAYMKGDEMVAYGEASVPAMKAGESRTVTVRPVTSVPGYDRVEIGVRSLL
jgi:hypothetical protein